MQYFVHSFRILHKVSYAYGWGSLIDESKDVDDETLHTMAMFLSVMFGVQGATSSLAKFASHVVAPAIHKNIARQALTKTSWYVPMKHALRLVGIKVTKNSFARGVSKAVPVAGGVVSGAITFVTLRQQALRLQESLRDLPPPGMDASHYTALVAAQKAQQTQEDGDLVTRRERITAFATLSTRRLREA